MTQGRQTASDSRIVVTESNTNVDPAIEDRVAEIQKDPVAADRKISPSDWVPS